MCQQCQDLVETLLAGRSQEEINRWLWECTCFPFSCSSIQRQLPDIFQKSGGNIDKAIDISYAQMNICLDNGQLLEDEVDNRIIHYYYFDKSYHELLLLDKEYAQEAKKYSQWCMDYKEGSD